MPPTLTRPRYVIAVPDLDRSAAFYRDVLGFTINPVDGARLSFFERDACIIFAGECRDALPPGELGDHSYYAYLEVSDVDALHAEVTGRGVEIVKPLQDEPWGMREFGIRTIDGHRMMFGGPITSR